MLQVLSLQHLLVLLRADASVSVGDADRQLLGTLNDVATLLGGDSVSDLGGVDAVLHHQHLQLLDVVHQELLEARRQHMTGTLGGSVTDVGHQVLSLEAATHSVVNSLRLAPVLLKGDGREGRLVMQVDDDVGVRMAYLQLGISVRLMANEALRALLHDCGSVRGLDGHFRAARR